MKALLKGIVVAFIGFLVSALIFAKIFDNGSVEGSFHAMTYGLLMFLIILIVACTSLILDAIKELKTENHNNFVSSSTTLKE